MTARARSRATAPPATTKLGRGLRALSGMFAGGLVVLALALVGVAIVATRAGSPGPGLDVLVWHAAAAVAAVPTQWLADRRPGMRGGLAAVAVLVIAAAVLTAYWVL
jgi:uncharacterized membrane protein